MSVGFPCSYNTHVSITANHIGETTAANVIIYAPATSVTAFHIGQSLYPNPTSLAIMWIAIGC